MPPATDNPRGVFKASKDNLKITPCPALYVKGNPMTTQEVLQKCRVEGNIAYLPDVALDRKAYLDVAKALNLIGGKWKGGKVKGFVFPSDPTELLGQVAKGEKRNLKKKYQFFATPDGLADHLVEMADLDHEDSILEPSAGQGAIIKAILRRSPHFFIDYCETMDVNKVFLSKISGAIFVKGDFLKLNHPRCYDKIIANPPFSKNQDIDHIRHMYDQLADGGRLVSVASRHWENSFHKKETAFQEWLDEVGAIVEPVDPGTFKASGTMIGACIITIDK